MWLPVPSCSFIAGKSQGFICFKPFTIEIAALHWLEFKFWVPECGCDVISKTAQGFKEFPLLLFASGFVYCRNEELETGWVAFGNGRLLHRPVSFDNKPHSLFQVVDQHTLQVKAHCAAELEPSEETFFINHNHL